MTKAELRAALVEALMPRNTAEAAAIVDALDLFMAYCGSYPGRRDRRFSLIDQTPPDPRAYEASTAIRARVVAAIGKDAGGARTLAQSIRVRGDVFDTSDVAETKKES